MERADVLIVGAGPGGLAAAAHLTRRRIPFVLIEAGAQVGTSWRGHYDRLYLHTTRTHSALPGLPFADGVPVYPSRNQVVEYLEQYAAHFGIQPRFGERLERAEPLTGPPEGWEIRTSAGRYRVRHLVMATGMNREPVRPTWPGQDRFRGRVLHSVEYRTGAAFGGRRALVVGIGNTGAEIALDLHEHGAGVAISVRTPQNILPRDFLGTPVQVTSMRTAFLPVRVRDVLGRFTSRMAFGDLSAYGLPAPPYGPATQVLKHGRTPLLDIGTVARIRSGDIAVVPAIESFTGSGVRLTGGVLRDVDVVVLATGYRAGLEALIDPAELRGRMNRSLHLIGYRNAITGLLRQVGLEAGRAACAIAAG